MTFTFYFQFLVLAFLSALLSTGILANQKITNPDKPLASLKHLKDGIEIYIGGEFFARYNFKILSQPIIWPVKAPGGITMLRDWPIKRDTEGEANDHPHHRAIFIGHQSLNGINYWHNQYKNSGVIKHLKIIDEQSGKEEALIKTLNAWTDKTGIKIGQDVRTLRFGGDQTARYLDLELEMRATNQDLVFEEFKDGFVGIRTHSDLRLTPNSKLGVNEVFGRALNSEGVEGKSIWGKRADWVHYFGKVNGKQAGIAFLSHPSNLRKKGMKSWWHARDYGLISANPFAPVKLGGNGNHVIKKGETLSLHYRMIFHRGSHKQAKIADRFASFAKIKS